MHGACSALCGASDAYQVVENNLGAETSESPGLEQCLPPSAQYRWAFAGPCSPASAREDQVPGFNAWHMLQSFTCHSPCLPVC